MQTSLSFSRTISEDLPELHRVNARCNAPGAREFTIIRKATSAASATVANETEITATHDEYAQSAQRPVIYSTLNSSKIRRIKRWILQQTDVKHKRRFRF